MVKSIEIRDHLLELISRGIHMYIQSIVIGIFWIGRDVELFGKFTTG